MSDSTGPRANGRLPEEPICIRARILDHMSKSIRVEDDTHAALAALEGEDETFDELLSV